MIYATGRKSILGYCSKNNISLQDFDEDVTVIDGVIDASYLLANCESFNSKVYLPDSVQKLDYAFYQCFNFNQPIRIPANAMRCTFMFYECYGFDQKLSLPETLADAYKMFYGCVSLTQQFKIPEDLEHYDLMLVDCPAQVTYNTKIYSRSHLYGDPKISDSLEQAYESLYVSEYEDAEEDNNSVDKINIKENITNVKSKLGNSRRKDHRSKGYPSDTVR